jgi:hypothetical protein
MAVIVTQSAERTWWVYAWAIASTLLAIGATVLRAFGKKREKRMQAGSYD